jgi:hypothetical protein
MESWMESAAIECADADSAGIDSGDMESTPMASACAGSPGASMSAGKPSQQISIENGRSLAGMNPGGMSARDASAASMMLAMSIRLLRLRGLKRISQGVILGGESYPERRNGVGR